MTLTQRRAYGAKLRAQATHTDVCGALYKYVNGQLFHYRVHHTWGVGSSDQHCWGTITLPASHRIFPIGEQA